MKTDEDTIVGLAYCGSALPQTRPPSWPPPPRRNSTADHRCESPVTAVDLIHRNHATSPWLGRLAAAWRSSRLVVVFRAVLGRGQGRAGDADGRHKALLLTLGEVPPASCSIESARVHRVVCARVRRNRRRSTAHHVFGIFVVGLIAMNDGC